MKNTLITIEIIISSIIGLAIVIYALFGLMSYLMSDLFHWINIAAPSESTTPSFQKDIDNCRAKDMYPIISAWNGQLRDCKPYK